MTDDRWYKDPADIAPYKFRWHNFLPAGETIVTADVVIDPDEPAPRLELVGSDVTGDDLHVTFKVSGGETTSPLTKALAVCTIHTSESNTYQAEKTITIKERRIQ